MKRILLPVLVFFTINAMAQTEDIAAIQELLHHQTEAWNRGDVEGFMQGYWKSDSLMFIGKSGITKGWQSTLNNYKKNYPDTTAMGHLAFDILVLKPLSSQYYYVVGRWMLQRSIGNLGGHFDLLFQKIRGRWYIIADHSS